MVQTVVFDATGAILGRMGSVVAKELLLGKKVIILHSEKVLVSGDSKAFIAKLNQKRKMGSGSSLKGPLYIRSPDMLLKRIIRGMLPWDRARGRDAFDRLRCYIGEGNLGKEEIAKSTQFKHHIPKNHATLGDIAGALRHG